MAGVYQAIAATPAHVQGHVHVCVSFIHLCTYVQVQMCPVLMLSISGDCGEYL